MYSNRSLFSSLILVFLMTAARGQSIAVLREKAEILYDKGEYSRSMEYYQKAYELSIKKDQPVWTANLLLDMGAVIYLSADYRACADLALKGCSILSERGISNDSTYFKLWSGLGEYYCQMSMIDSSLYFFGKADHLLVTNPGLRRRISEYVIYHYGNQALAHRSMGRYTQGIVLADRGLDLALSTHNLSATGLLRNVLADQYEKTGEYQKAYQLRLEALSVYPYRDQKKARIYSGLGINAVYRGDFPAALRHLGEAFGLMKQVAGRDHSQNNVTYIADILNITAYCYLKLKKYDEAAATADRALAAFKPLPGKTSPIAARSYLLKGLSAFAKNNFAKAEMHYQTSWEYLSGKEKRPGYLGFEMMAVEVLRAKGEKHMRCNEKIEALNAFEQALDRYHSARQDLFIIDDKLFMGASVLTLYSQALEAAYRVYLTKRDNATFDRAFRIAIQNHAVALRDAFREAEVRPVYLPQILTKKEDSLKRELFTLQTLSQSKNEVSPDDRERLVAVQQSYYNFRRKVQDAYPAYYKARYLPPDEPPKELMARLDDESALISFTYAEGNLHLFALTNKASVWKTVPLDSAVMVRTLYELRETALKHPGIREYKGSAYALNAFDWFIRPVYSAIAGKKNWIIQTGGLLQGVPVEVFEIGRRPGDYVALSHRTRYVYTTLSLASKPVSGLSAPHILALAPFAPGLSGAPGNFPDLPWSREEVAQIAPDQHYLAQNANKETLLAALGRFDVLHLATHTFSDPDNPFLSYVALHPDSNGQDRWYGREISGTNLQHLRLAVLSACEAEKGQHHPIEGTISLARCFAYAGCSQLVTSISGAAVDQATAIWMKYFYEHLKKGLPPSEAIFLARKDFLETPAGRSFNHPFFWANFILVGDDAPVYPAPKHNYLKYTLLFLMFSCVVAVLIKTSKSARYGPSKP